MPFEAEIKQAGKIADEWLARSQQDEDFFIGLKKENVKWEKEYIKQIEERINGARNREALEMIELSRDQLKEFQDVCEVRFKKHADFVRGNPRRGSVGVADEMKLKKGTPVYEAVSDAMDKVLIAHTKQFKATEEAWQRDLLVRLDLLRSKLDTLEKLATGAEGKMSAYGKQLDKDAAAYKAEMENAVVALKVSMAETAMSSIVANKATWCAGIKKTQRDQYKIFVDRLSAIDKLRALSLKNHSRVMKSLPPEVARQRFALGKTLKVLDDARDKVQKDLDDAKKAFEMAVKMIEKFYPDIV